jgi:hypothetical protein
VWKTGEAAGSGGKTRQKGSSFGILSGFDGEGRGVREQRFCQMGSWGGRKSGAIVQGLLKRSLVPAGEFQRIEVLNYRDGIELVQAGHNVVVLQIGESAEVEDEVRTAAFDGNLKTGAFDVAVAKPESFSCKPQA